MSDRQFFDTNVIVYAYDRADPVKQEHTRRPVKSSLIRLTRD